MSGKQVQWRFFESQDFTQGNFPIEDNYEYIGFQVESFDLLYATYC
jgi:hypothetical protein